jgi:hypothetical protein
MLDTTAWMDHRLWIFKNFTMPSMISQTSQDFRWLLAFDSRTPKAYIDEIVNVGYQNIEILMVCPAEAPEDVIKNFDGYKQYVYAETGGADWRAGCNSWREAVARADCSIITTRIDNDDAFGVDFIKDIQHTFSIQAGNQRQSSAQNRYQRPYVITFVKGYVYEVGATNAVLMDFPRNNCPSLVADYSYPDTIRSFKHSGMFEKFTTVKINHHKPSWLMVVHGKNQCNDHLLSGRGYVKKHVRWVGATPEFFKQFGVTYNVE